MAEIEIYSALDALQQKISKIPEKTVAQTASEVKDQKDAAYETLLKNTERFQDETYDIITKLPDQISKIKSEVQKLQKDFDDKINITIEDLRDRIVNTLGIFVALFTFASIEFGILKGTENLNLVVLPLTLILVGTLFLFVLALDFLTRIRTDQVLIIPKNFRKLSIHFYLFFLSCILIIIGILLATPKKADQVDNLNNTITTNANQPHQIASPQNSKRKILKSELKFFIPLLRSLHL